MNRFQGKIVLVTGGNRNTGLSIVEKFVAEGARVFMCGSTPESTAKGAAALAAQGCTGVRSIPCDVSDLAQVKNLFDIIEKEAGHLDILVNNAAHQGIGKPFTEMDPAYVMEVLGVNVQGGFQVTQQAVNRFFLKQPERGVVVFLSSNTAMRAIRNRTAYCASKGAINSMVRAIALDLAPLGIRVNACAPGYIYTERWDVLPEEKKARRRLNCPLRREATGMDIANVVAFLASEDSANMTGEIVTCDAGCSCQHMPEDVDL
ncbi:MAG: SDR family oxidoreductase [Lentisphaerae bacterium]|jgi:NAD(P)-dependent dehydrogenase (short-subunit alcohol dehydrogenase family)|nr:SDR family oxidoreductase [Lentisphaerota bacterium]